MCLYHSCYHYSYYLCYSSYLLLLLHVTEGYVRVNGEITFDLQVFDSGGKIQRSLDEQMRNDSEKRAPARIRNRNTTVAPPVECVYQYPEEKQVNAVLSNMMNQLAKIFVRANEYMSMRSGRREEQRKIRRFKIVDKVRTSWFEDIYQNMTKEYRQSYNNTSIGIQRTGQDPCQHQNEIKEMWRKLLNNSATALKKAALKCVDETLHSRNKTVDNKTKNILKQFLVKELTKVRSRQLDTLCESFQLCYNELL